MTAQLIKVDFRARTYYKPETLEQMAVDIMAPFVDTAPSELNPDYRGEGLDGIPYWPKEPA